MVANIGAGQRDPMTLPLIISLAFFIGIVALAVIGRRLDGADQAKLPVLGVLTLLAALLGAVILIFAMFRFS
jgi:hypothetical protein